MDNIVCRNVKQTRRVRKSTTYGLLLTGMSGILICLLAALYMIGRQPAYMLPTAIPVQGKLPAPTQQSVFTEATDWELILVNDRNPIQNTYSFVHRTLPNGLQVDERIYEPLMQMLQDGEAQGLRFVICSAYRTLDYQQQLYDNKVQRLMAQGMEETQAREEAGRVVAFSGCSEHHLGLAVDIVSQADQRLEESATRTPEYRWLAENCHRYGFIVRYPEGKSDLTHIIYEPWHFRYVGKEHAAAITERGICLEEYLEERK